MSEKNILLKMTLEKNRMIKEVISNFLGHEPTGEEKKEFKVMHGLGESNIYFKGELIGHVSFQSESDDDSDI
ncbi:MAG: hypothetical protein ACJ75F_10835 [Flavisolibacter sp.]|jgi:hypothetical protein